MRPGQQNNNNNSNKNRQRGRNNNGGRKHQNPLSRNYESNGPDVKVRGTAAHIAEKYVQLARDAQASGDSVMAENYFQHAEHYFRIISAAQPQMTPRYDQFGQEIEESDEDGEEIVDALEQHARIPDEQPREDRQQRDDRPPRDDRRRDRNRDDRQPRIERPAFVETAAGDEQAAEAPVENAPVEAVAEEGEAKRPRRPRRRRTTSDEGDAGAADAPQPDVGDLPAFITAGGATAAE